MAEDSYVLEASNKKLSGTPKFHWDFSREGLTFMTCSLAWPPFSGNFWMDIWGSFVLQTGNSCVFSKEILGLCTWNLVGPFASKIWGTEFNKGPNQVVPWLHKTLIRQIVDEKHVWHWQSWQSLGGSLIWIDILNISKSKKLSILLILAQIWSFGRKKPGETPNPRLLTLNPWNVKLASRRQSPMPSFHVLGVSPARNAKNEKWISGGKERKVWYQRLVLHTVILIILVVFSSTWCTWVRWVHWHMLQLYGVYRCISTCTYDNNINACKYKINGYPHATYRVFQDMTASQHQTGRPVSKVNLGRRPWSSWCPFLLRGFGIQIFEMASSWSKDMV